MVRYSVANVCTLYELWKAKLISLKYIYPCIYLMLYAQDHCIHWAKWAFAQGPLNIESPTLQANAHSIKFHHNLPPKMHNE
jgi:hypothetical protein